MPSSDLPPVHASFDPVFETTVRRKAELDHNGLSARRCPFTGVINLYRFEDPHIAVAAIAKCGTRAAAAGFTWRCFTSDAEQAGHAPDLETAQTRLSTVLTRSVDQDARDLIL